MNWTRWWPLVFAGLGWTWSSAAGQASGPAQATATPAAVSPFQPDTVFAPLGGPRVVLLRTAGRGVAAMRLSVPLVEGPAEAGAGRILRELALDRMRSLARPVGARVSVSRTPWGLAYTVEGASADFEYLAYLLREAVAEPRASRGALADARGSLREEASRPLELPRERLVRDLRAQVAPGFAPPEGTPGTVAQMDAARVADVWRRSHQASAMTLVVSAPVVPEVILAATRSIGAPESERAAPLDAPAPQPEPAPPVQTLRTWLGLAFSHFPVDDVHGAVAALLVTGALESTRGDFETSVELRELPDRWMLTILGAAYPGQARAMRSAVSGALATTLETLDPSEVRAAVARVEQSLRLGARTPAGLVEAVGRSAEATGDPGSAAHRMEQLGRVDAESVRGTLRTLLERGPVRAEVGR